MKPVHIIILGISIIIIYLIYFTVTIFSYFSRKEIVPSKQGMTLQPEQTAAIYMDKPDTSQYNVKAILDMSSPKYELQYYKGKYLLRINGYLSGHEACSYLEAMDEIKKQKEYDEYFAQADSAWRKDGK